MNKLIYLLLLGSIPLLGTAQPEVGLHFLPRAALTQSTNPAFMQDKLISISLPGVYLAGEHQGFALGDLLRPVPGTDSLQVDLNRALSRLGPHNYLRMQSQLAPLAIGVKLGPAQISLSTRARAQAYMGYPKEWFALAAAGNAAYLGENIELAPDLQALAYSELALGGALKLGSKLQVGLQAKYLFGHGALRTGQRSISFRTDPEYYQLHAEVDYQLQMAGLSLGRVDSLADWGELNPGYSGKAFGQNQGLALDLGAVYSLSDKWRLSLSVLDLGGINWSSQATEYQLQGSIDFEGLDVMGMLLGDSTDIGEIMDSLLQHVRTGSAEQSFYTPLPTQAYLSAVFSPLKSLRIGGLIHLERISNRWQPTYALNGSKDLGKWVTVGLSYALRSGRYDGLGLQGLVRLGPFRAFVISDQILAPLRPMKSKAFSLRIGAQVSF